MDITKILDELGATGDERAGIEAFFTKNAGAAQKVADWHENGLRQSDYDRKMNGWKAQKEAEERRLKEAEATLIGSRDKMNQQYLDALKEREEAVAAKAALEAKMKTLADAYSIDPNDLKLGETPPSKTVTQPPNPQPTGDFVSRKDFEEVAGLLDRSVMLPVKLQKMQRQHHELFGNHFDEEELLAEAKRQERPIEQVWNDKFGVAQKREEVTAAKYRAEGKAAADQEWQAKVSQKQVEVMRTDLQPRSPIFEVKRPTAAEPVKDRTSSGVDAAVAAFNAGKYREQRSA